MDKTKHSDVIFIITYALMAFCWAGKNLLPVGDMVICGLSGVILGVVTVFCEKLFKLPTYICRGIGVFAAALLIIEIYFFTGWVQTDAITIIASMVPPVAAGAMLIEGMCTAKNKSGVNKIITAILVSIFIALGITAALAITRLRGLPI